MSKLDKIVLKLIPFAMVLAVINIYDSYMNGSRVGYFINLAVFAYFYFGYYYKKEQLEKGKK